MHHPWRSTSRLALLTGSLLILFAALASANELIVDTIHPGETARINSRGVQYDLKLIMVSSGPHISPRALFSLNGERSKALGTRDRYHFSDGSILALGNILPNEAGEGTGGSLVEYYFIGSGMSFGQDTEQDYYQGDDIEYDLSSLGQGYPSPYQYPSPYPSESAWPSVAVIQPRNPINSPLLVENLPPTIIKPAPTRPPDETAPAGLPCASDADCDDHDGCTIDSCALSLNRCQHTTTMKGCSFGTSFCVPTFRSYILPPGTGVYCGIDGSWVEQAPDSSPCQGDFECQSGFCDKKQCTTLTAPAVEQPAFIITRIERAPTFLDRAGQLFQRLFSGQAILSR